MTEAAQTPTVDVADILLDPTVQTSLNTILAQLPQLATLMTALTKNEETLTSLVKVMENLPAMANLLHLVTRVYQAGEDIVTDGDSLDGFVKMAQNYAEPLLGTVKKGRVAFETAKERAAHDTTTYSVFGLMKMLKDPNVQKGIRFTQALLDALGEPKAHA